MTHMIRGRESHGNDITNPYMLSVKPTEVKL
jgi:hypothetical protein